MSSQKQVLIWNHDNRSIGIIDDEDTYIPVILYNFTVIGNINDQHHPYRGWVCLVKTTDGQSFDVILSVDEVKLPSKLGVLISPTYLLMRPFGQSYSSG